MIRERLQKKEAELQGAKADRANAQMEKAALERQLKQVQSQTGRMTKDLEKKVRWFVPMCPVATA
jgi:ABC-type phosphate transport system auxiliary subunit